MKQPSTYHSLRASAHPLMVLLLSSHSRATTFSVTNTANSGAGSLRQAILDANADATATAASPHRITFSVSGTITIRDLTLAKGGNGG